MTAPDPGLTADHTFQSGGGGDGYTEPFCFGAECSCGEVYESWVQSADDDEGHDFDLDRLADLHAAHVALVVAQHTNGRIAELEAELEKYHAEERRELEWDRFCAQQDVRCTECGLRYGERKDYTCPHIGEHKYDADELRAALEGEQQ